MLPTAAPTVLQRQLPPLLTPWQQLLDPQPLCTVVRHQVARRTRVQALMAQALMVQVPMVQAPMVQTLVVQAPQARSREVRDRLARPLGWPTYLLHSPLPRHRREPGRP